MRRSGWARWSGPIVAVVGRLHLAADALGPGFAWGRDRIALVETPVRMPERRAEPWMLLEAGQGGVQMTPGRFIWRRYVK
ncbi:MAG: hypothetical protein JWR52_1070 [Marmoricola sp.]|nr:hypothetical protein [Marmoricola sp.]